MTREHKCVKCGKVFASKYTLGTHLNKKISCDNKKSKTEPVELIEPINDVKINIEEPEKIDELTESEIICMREKELLDESSDRDESDDEYDYGDVVLIAYGKEDLDTIVDDNLCIYFLGFGIDAVRKLIKYVHFNRRYPQFQNCYIDDLESDNAIIYDGTEWITVDRQTLLNHLLESKFQYLKMRFSTICDKKRH